jgi:hypothetical protein
MIKGIRIGGMGAALSFLDTLVVPIIENTPNEEDLKDSMAEAMAEYPNAPGVLVRRHGVYVWGADWEKAKTQTEVRLPAMTGHRADTATVFGLSLRNQCEDEAGRAADRAVVIPMTYYPCDIKPSGPVASHASIPGYVPPVIPSLYSRMSYALKLNTIIVSAAGTVSPTKNAPWPDAGSRSRVFLAISPSSASLAATALTATSWIALVILARNEWSTMACNIIIPCATWMKSCVQARSVYRMGRYGTLSNTFKRLIMRSR